MIRATRSELRTVAGRDVTVHVTATGREYVSVWAVAAGDDARRAALRLQLGRAVVRFRRAGGGEVEGVPVDVAERVLAGGAP